MYEERIVDPCHIPGLHVQQQAQCSVLAFCAVLAKACHLQSHVFLSTRACILTACRPIFNHDHSYADRNAVMRDTRKSVWSPGNTTTISEALITYLSSDESVYQ